MMHSKRINGACVLVLQDYFALQATPNFITGWYSCCLQFKPEEVCDE
jgi:hypothetical protein